MNPAEIANCLDLRLSSLEAGGVLLAEDIRLTLRSGVLTLIKGPNGAGKSTLLRRFREQLAPETVFYKPPFGLRDELTVSQQSGLFAELMSPGAKGSKLSELLHKLDLFDWRSELVGSLSSGQRARLGMLPLCLSEHPVWLLDEPLNALDARSMKLLAGLIAEHLASGGKAIMVSHLGVNAFSAMHPEVRIETCILSEGRLQVAQNSSEIQSAGYAASDLGEANSTGARTVASAKPAMSLFDLTHLSFNMRREWLLLKASPHNLLWSGLFNLMVISFFGLSLNKPEMMTGLAVIWVSVLLSIMLSVKDWFSEDLRSGWLELSQGCRPGYMGSYWLAKVAAAWIANSSCAVPVVLVGGLFLGIPLETVAWTLAAVLTGLFAIMPLLGLVSLMVMLTRSGVILVYILGLPLIVPALLFGIEASRAVALGREPGAVLLVLVLAGGLGLLIGPKVSVRLMQVIQE